MQCLGERSIHLAENYYYYGVALLRKWSADKNVFGGDIPEETNAS